VKLRGTTPRKTLDPDTLSYAARRLRSVARFFRKFSAGDDIAEAKAVALISEAKSLEEDAATLRRLSNAR